MSKGMECLAPWAGEACGVDTTATPPVAVRAWHRRGHLRYAPATPEAAVSPDTAVACGMVPGAAMAVWLTAPLVSPSKTVRVLPTLLDMALPFPLEECISTFSPPECRLPEDGGEPGMTALAVAARKQDVERRLAELAAAGMDPHVLDHEGLALWTQALRELPPEPGEGPRVVMMVRPTSVLTAVGAGGRFHSAHRSAMADIAGLERTLRIQVHAVAGAHALPEMVKWIWAGDPDAWAAVRPRLEAALPGVSSSVEAPDLFLARALAIRALTRGPLRCNLRTGTFTHPQSVRQTAHVLYRRAAVLGGLAGVLLVINAFCAYSATRQLRRAETWFMGGVRQVAGYAVPARGENALLIAERELAARMTAESPFATAYRASLLDTLNGILTAVATSEPPHVHSLRVGFDRIAIRGVASRTDAATLMHRLAPLGYALSLDPGTGTTADETVPFVIEGNAGRWP